MARITRYVPRVAIFLAGVAAATVAASARRNRREVKPEAVENLRRALAALEAKLGTRLDSRESATELRLSQVESRLELHETRLADVPSTSQIVTAMEQLLSKTMSSLDDRLTNQANSIEVLKDTVSQADALLERVLESLDSLQSFADPAELADEPLPRQ